MYFKNNISSIIYCIYWVKNKDNMHNGYNVNNHVSIDFKLDIFILKYYKKKKKLVIPIDSL